MRRAAVVLSTAVMVAVAGACAPRDMPADTPAAAPSSASVGVSTSSVPADSRDLEGWLVAWEKLHPGQLVERNSPDAEDVMDAGWELCSTIGFYRRGELTRDALNNVAGVYGATSGDDLVRAAELHLCPP